MLPSESPSSGRQSELVVSWRFIVASLILTIASNFGQSFYISLSTPYFLAALDLSAGHFGTLYGGATLLSACLLPSFGRLLDRSCPRRFTVFTLLGLSASSLALSMTHHVIWLFFAILGVRFTGQGLCSLIASTSIGRQFHSSRGKALGLAGLGYPLGEAALPILALLAMGAWGWRLPWVGVAILTGTLLPWILAVLIPAQPSKAFASGSTEATGGESDVRSSTIKSLETFQWLQDRAFLAMIPGILALPVVMTAVLVHQAHLMESRGWPIPLIAGGLAAFAGTRIFSSLAIGPVIDRFGALRLVPSVLVPLGLGVAYLAAVEHSSALFIFFLMAGLSQGMSSGILTSAWAEIYGSRILGTVKGRVTMLAILGSALGPIVVGWGLDFGWSMDAQLWGLLGMSTMAAILSWVAVRRYRRRSMPIGFDSASV